MNKFLNNNSLNAAILYHLKELEIAKDTMDPKNSMPNISKKDQLILDIGCGIGQTFVALDLGKDNLPIGIDIDFESLSYGKKQFQNIIFINGIAENLPFKDCSFDLIISRVTLPFTNIPVSIKEIRRVLKVNGRIWLVLHPFSMVVNRLIRAMIHFKIKKIIYYSYVIVNGILLNFFRLQFPFLKDKKYESFQTKFGMSKLLITNNFKDVNFRSDRSFIADAKKKSN